MKHYTPCEIVDVLAQFAPENIQILLEPSVGNGNLLTPFLKRKKVRQIIAIDKEPNVIQDLRNKHGNRGNFTLVNGDFLEWSQPANSNMLFDCVVMNPPFMAKNKALIKIDMKEEQISIKKQTKYLPIEVVFVLRAIRLLKSRGTLLAIVPASIINASKTSWLREHFLSQGHIERVYELPRYTFKGIEAKTFLLVFVKGRKDDSTILAMYQNGNTQEKIVSREEIKAALRLDYSYFTAKLELARYLETTELGWTPLGKITNTSRGKIPAPPTDDDVIHYTNFANGFWRIPRNDEKLELPIYLSDILIGKRVGRDCLSAYGLGINIKDAKFSDCVITIQIQDESIDKIALLFSLRTLFSMPGIHSLLKLGTGATYISELQLRETFIPLELYSAEPELFREYQKAVRELDFEKMKQLENAAAVKISEYTDPCCLNTGIDPQGAAAH